MFDNKAILITGGTGSFGKKYTEILLKKYKPKKASYLLTRRAKTIRNGSNV